MNAIKIKEEFNHRLANRDKSQGDGTFTAIEFRDKFLAKLDNQEIWKSDKVEIVFDFSGIKKIGPSLVLMIYIPETKSVFGFIPIISRAGFKVSG